MLKTKMLLEYDDSPGTTRSAKLFIVHVIDFPFLVNRRVPPFSTRMDLSVFEQSVWSNGTAGVSSSNCTVANRSRSWTKTGAYSFICTAPGRGKSLMEFWTLSKYPLYLSLILLAQHCALKLPNPQQTYDLLCFWRLQRRIKRSCLRLWACIFPSQIPRHFAGTICLSWRFLRQLFLKKKRARISLMKFTFLDNDSRLPFSFPNSVLHQVHPENFLVSPAEAFNPNSSTFPRIELIGSEFWDTQPWTFFFLSE